MSAARFGEPFQVTSVAHVKLGDKVYVGLAASAHNSDAYETVQVSNVHIIVPAPKDFVPYRDYIGSDIERLSSHVRRPDGSNYSTICTVPVEGSEKATLITDTDQGHSYLHGFAPDDRTMIFTGQHDPAMRANSPKVLNLYTIDVASKKKTQLTTTPALDDGAE